jgi:hypothetical protein
MIRWEDVTNERWLRGVWTRDPNPTSFTRAMMMDRPANGGELMQYIQWCHGCEIRVSYLNDGLLAFDTIEDKMVFLLRWAA